MTHSTINSIPLFSQGHKQQTEISDILQLHDWVIILNWLFYTCLENYMRPSGAVDIGILVSFLWDVGFFMFKEIGVACTRTIHGLMACLPGQSY